MFCLFKSSRLTPSLHTFANGLAWFAVLAWLYFAFVEKSFLDNFWAGQSLLIDLLLGLPIVLIFAVVVYAMVYWPIKVLVILVYPAGVEPVVVAQPLDDTLPEHLPQDYWQASSSSEEQKSKKEDRPS